ncbi:MAG: ECF transporter S component [Clostridia bacterium]|nr:ECF transporter S component [Clostridia bacterium]
MKNHENIRNLLFAALFLSLAFIMPFLTGQIPEIGSKLCPMHIPVLLCGFILGPSWGAVVGFTAPLFRSLTLGMPVLFPGAVCMAFELATYGLVAGLSYRLFAKIRFRIYSSLLVAMAMGRLVWGAAMLVCTGIKGGQFTLAAFIAGAFTNAIPGILIQIVLVPVLVKAFEAFGKEKSGSLTNI